MKLARIVAVLAVTALVSAALVAAKYDSSDSGELGPAAFGLEYHMMIDAVELRPHGACSMISKVVVEDARGDKAEIGKRKWEDGSGPSGDWPITVSGDVGAWLQKGAETLLANSKIKLGGEGPVLSIKLLSLALSEERHDNSVWAGAVELRAELRKEPGAACWHSEYYGGGKNWGDPENLVNYQETVNRALDRALADMIKDGTFREALCGTCK